MHATALPIHIREFSLRERARFQFRAESYDTFNHTQFTTVNTSPKWNYAAGAFTSTQFGQITAARDPRYLQFGLKVLF